MARFQFNVRAVVASLPARAGVSQRTLQALDLIGADEPPQGPGWFDSSWELIRGLEVHEGLPFDARLHDRLRACLRGESDARVDAALVPRRTLPDQRLDPFSEFKIEGLELL